MPSIPFTKLKIDPSGTLLAIARGSKLFLLSIETGIPFTLEGSHHTGTIRSIAFNKNGTSVVSAGDDKLVKQWTRTESTWANSATIKIPKKPTGVEYTDGDQLLIISDKAGDVYRQNINATNEEPNCIMGHYASITDMVLTKNGRYVITGDKDEHIRVSHYPHAYDIAAFCLGHTEFISGLLVSKQQPDILLSGGGDGTLRLWNLKEGKLLDYIFVGDNQGKKSEEADTVIPLAFQEEKQIVVVSVEEKPILYFFQIVDNKLVCTTSLGIRYAVGSADFDKKGNLWISYLPTNKLPHLETTENTTSTATTATTTEPPHNGQDKIAVLVLEGGAYKVDDNNGVSKLINSSFDDADEESVFLATLKDLSRNLQFRKKFGDGDFVLHEPSSSSSTPKKRKGKKAKIEQEKKGSKEPTIPTFVAQ